MLRKANPAASFRHFSSTPAVRKVLDFRGNAVANTGGPLAGIRVIELGSFVAGPHCGTLLSYFGAEVIKIEPPGGDQLRQLRVKDETDTSYWWRSSARNKKCVVMNLKNEGAQELVKQLCAESDVLVENFRPGLYYSIFASYFTSIALYFTSIATSISLPIVPPFTSISPPFASVYASIHPLFRPRFARHAREMEPRPKGNRRNQSRFSLYPDLRLWAGRPVLPARRVCVGV